MSRRDRLQDASDRRAAATDFSSNIVVVAGAGTGKTSLLVERILNGLLLGRFGMDEFAAMTFTEKAASEMRERLARSLEDLRGFTARAADPDETREAGRCFLYLAGEAGLARRAIEARAIELLEELDRAQVGTIHSFCADILRAFPIEAGVDPAFEVDAGERFESLLEERWPAFLVEELGSQSERAELWRRLLERARLDEIAQVALGSRHRGGEGRSRDGLVRFGIPGSLRVGGSSQRETAERLRTLGRELVDRIGAILARQEGMNPRFKDFLERLARAFRLYEAGGTEALREQIAGDELLAAWITGEKERPEVGSKLAGVGKAQVEETSKLARLLLRSLAKADDELAGLVTDCLAPFVTKGREAYLASGFLDFDGLLVLARDLLRDHPNVREALKRRYRALLVDEFQDTDPIQYEIVLFLAERPGASATDAYSAELAPGKLFIVGDPKQSIYRFRGADYTAFRRTVARVEECGGRTLTLTTNFRSLEGIVAAVNALFTEGEPPIWRESPYCPAYIPIAAARTEAEAKVELWTVEFEGSSSDRREAEAAAIAGEIGRLVEAGEANYSDIFVLLRAFSDVAAYMRALRSAAIPFVVDGGKEFFERAEVVALRSVLRALVRPSDEVALLAYLRSPAGAVEDRELARYAAAGRRWSWSETPDPGAFPGLARAFRRLRELSAVVRDLPADAAVRRVAAETGLAPLLALGFAGAQAVANLGKLVAEAADLAKDGRAGLDTVLDLLERERFAGEEPESPLADERMDAVRILTIHKAKGLENRIVFVADLAREEKRQGGPPAVRVLRLPSGTEALSLGIGGWSNSVRALEVYEEHLHEEAERLRLLYVALTRASERLVLVAARDRRGRSPGLEALSAWGYDASEPPADGETLAAGVVRHHLIRPGPIERRGPPKIERAEPAGAIAAYRSAAERLEEEAARRALSRASPEFEEEQPGEEAEPRRLRKADSRERPEARAVGAAIHRALERWDPSKGSLFLEELGRIARPIAQVLGADPVEVEREAETILRRFLDSPQAARLRDVEILGRELPVVLAELGGKVWTGRCDLLYRDRDGGHVVADYKTDETDNDDEGLLKRYGNQLAVYARAVERALGLTAPPRAELWLLRSGRIVEVPLRAREIPDPKSLGSRRTYRTPGRRKFHV